MNAAKQPRDLEAENAELRRELAEREAIVVEVDRAFTRGRHVLDPRGMTLTLSAVDVETIKRALKRLDRCKLCKRPVASQRRGQKCAECVAGRLAATLQELRSTIAAEVER